MDIGIGSKVRIIKRHNIYNDAVGVVRDIQGRDENDEEIDNPFCVEFASGTILLSEGYNVGTMSDWFCEDELELLEADSKGEIKDLVERKIKNKKIYKKIEISVARKDGRTILKLKLPDEFETFFSNIVKGEIQTSEKWLYSNGSGVKFYKWGVIPEIQQDTVVVGFIPKSQDGWLGNNFYNNFGNSLMNNMKVNIAPLRAVGTKDGIEIIFSDEDTMSNNDFQYYIKELAIKAKGLYQDKIKNASVRAVISFEL